MRNIEITTVVVLAVAMAACGGEPSFHALGDLPGGDFLSRALGISGDGSVVVGYSISVDAPYELFEAFKWDAVSGLVGLGHLDGHTSSSATDASVDGSIIVGQSKVDRNSYHHAYRWDATNGMVDLGDLPGGRYQAYAGAVSADGSVIAGQSYSHIGNEACRWDASGRIIPMGRLPGSDLCTMSAVSADGSVMAGTDLTTSTLQAVRWEASTGLVGLGALDGARLETTGMDISADGTVIVGYGITDAGREAFRWDAVNGMVALGDLPGGAVSAYGNGVSADGSVVVGMGMSGPSTHEAFYWTADRGMRPLHDILVNDFGLDLTGWHLRAANAVSDDGLTITGTGYNPNGDVEAWVATVPEPATLSLLALSGLAMLRRRRR